MKNVFDNKRYGEHQEEQEQLNLVFFWPMAADKNVFDDKR